ncbi:unnamed protein product [Zymoseptoria tritici ST99CH_1A5]|uniref:Uncharacterized protein n=1 Tax=Zymoseptoria tritici ST99CH_1A5 TaxID=1276529 RepID=A0A1Y6LGV8_ZYMTR|nr:unnamed protein product [Zymoseptoria tritici ST99CH_1A5]
MTSQVPRLDQSEWCANGEPGLEFDNSGKRSLLVPGIGHPIPIELPSAERFAHGFNDWAQNRLTAREMEMLRFMNRITDRPGWFEEAHHLSRTVLWAEEAARSHLISAAAWDWCYKELRDKAEYYQKTGLTLVFDSSSRICNLNCGRCGRRGSGGILSSWEERGGRFSPEYQWLPCEVDIKQEFFSNGKPKVRISSYINNLHPRHHASLYDSIEKCVEASIRSWNEILTYRYRGRTPERIRTFGVQWSPPPPDSEDLDDFESMLGQGQGGLYTETKQRLDRLLQRPDNSRAPSESRLWTSYPPFGPDLLVRRDRYCYALNPTEALVAKHHRTKRWLHPEPGTAFSYEDWRKGKNNGCVVPGHAGYLHAKKVDDPFKEDHEFYTIDIEERFADNGLQVVVEIGSVDLTPDDPHRSRSEWQLSGLSNDHIVAKTIVYPASENVSSHSGSLSFRVEAHLDPPMHVYGINTGSDPFHPLDPLADIYDFESHLELNSGECMNSPGGPMLQFLGTVAAPDGRLIAFPNSMQHRTEEFSLLDPTRPGRRRWLKLHLVDPHYRICSTRNVPPQQFDRWYEAGFGRIDWEARQMPTELVQEIEAMVGEFAITAEEAEKIKERIRTEREDRFEIVMENMPLYCFADYAADGDVSRYRP